MPGFLTNNSAFQQVVRYCLKHPVNTWHRVKGFGYEIQTALRLERNGEKVIEFGKRILTREFDLVTREKLIECKNINWKLLEFNSANSTLVEKVRDMKGIFGDQLKIAKDVGKTFIIYSQEQMPLEWKEWFVKKGITFFEG